MFWGCWGLGGSGDLAVQPAQQNPPPDMLGSNKSRGTENATKIQSCTATIVKQLGKMHRAYNQHYENKEQLYEIFN